MYTKNQMMNVRKAILVWIAIVGLILSNFYAGNVAPAYAQEGNPPTPKYKVNFGGMNSDKLAQEAQDAIALAMDAWPDASPENDTFYLIDLNWHHTWATGTLTSANLDTPLQDGEESHLHPGNMFAVLLTKVNGKWEAAIEMDEQNVTRLLDVVPNSELGSTARTVLFSQSSKAETTDTADAATAQVYTNYKFPWPSGNAWYLTWGWHDGAYYGYQANYGLDFDIGGPDGSNSDILASAPGIVNYMCNYGTQAMMVITTDGTNERFGYLHLDSTTLRFGQGAHVNQGDVLGRMLNTDPGYFSDGCGRSNRTHLHIYVPAKPLSMDGYVFSDSSLPSGSTALYSTQGSVGVCQGPPLLNPVADFVSQSQTVTFSWSAPSGCTFNGYTFRIKDVPTMDSGGNLVDGIDHGVGGTSTTETISSQWNNRDLYWGVRAANASSGSSWSVRKFRIEPSLCPTVSGVARLYDGQSCSGSSIDAGLGLLQLEQNNFNDMAESIAIPSGWSARLYLHNSESSPSACFSSTDTNLSDNTFSDGTNIANQTTWVRVYTNSSCTAGSPPSAPATISPTNGQSFNEGDVINLTWTATGSEYYGEVMGGPAVTTYFGWQTGISKNIGAQWAGYVYSWHVKARNSYGESGWSFAPTFTVLPAAPTNLSTAVVSCNQINLSWSDNSGNEEGYKVYRNGSLIATLGSNITSYQDAGLTGNTSYPYTVKAYRGSIDSNASNTATATTTTCATTPNTPTNFRVSDSTQTSITVAWDNVSNETGFKIYRWGHDGTQWTFIYLDSVGADITSYTQNNLDCGSGFNYYEVSAYNANGESQHASWIQGTTLPCAFGKTSPTDAALNQLLSVTLGWAASNGATSYEYCYDTTNDNACSNWVSNDASTSATLSGLSPATTYYWQVRAIDAGGTTYANGSVTVFWSFTTQNDVIVCPTTINYWKGEYWNNPSLTGTSTICKDDTELNFDWGYASADPLIPSDGFSARWTRTVYFASGTYRFYLGHDDGARLFIDDMTNPVMDRWTTCCVVDQSNSITLTEGNHIIKMEYFENGGAANARLWWEPLYVLSVNKSGTGSGTVTSNPTGIDCGSDCSEPYSDMTDVRLTATPAVGSTFAGWSGHTDCADGLVSMNADRSCIATFNLQSSTPVNTGLLNPTSNTAQSGGDRNGYEVNTSTAYANDSVFAMDVNSGTGTNTSCTDKKKDNHLFYNYGISLPGTSTVQGIEILLDAKADSTVGSPKLCIQLSWNGGASWTTVKQTGTLSTTEQTYTLGSPTDTWGRVWTIADLSNANFRVRIIDVASDTARDFSLDSISVRVTYR
jgi:hypothetical protein